MYAYCAHSLVMRDKKNEKQWRKLPMTTAQIALSVIMIVASLFLIVVVLLQHGAQQGLGGSATAPAAVCRVRRADSPAADPLRHDLRTQ